MFEKNLPALFVKIEGNVSTNIAEFKTEIDSYVGSINKELVTDEHFAQAELDVKFCKKTEQELVRVKEAALNQSVDIKRAMDMLGSMGENIRQVRLRLEKLVKKEKENRKDAIINAGVYTNIDQARFLNNVLQGFSIPSVDYNSLISEAIKGKKTLESMNEAVDDVVSECMKSDNEIAELMNKNIECLNKAKDNGYGFLFNDFDQYVHLDNEHVVLMIISRIDEHKKIEAEKEKVEEARRLKAVEDARIEAVRLAAVEIAKQKEAAEEAMRQAEAKRIFDIKNAEEKIRKDAVLEARQQLMVDKIAKRVVKSVKFDFKSDKKESVQKVNFDYNDDSWHTFSSVDLDVLFNSSGEICIKQDGENYLPGEINLTINSLKEILEKMEKNT